MARALKRFWVKARDDKGVWQQAVPIVVDVTNVVEVEEEARKELHGASYGWRKYKWWDYDIESTEDLPVPCPRSPRRPPRRLAPVSYDLFNCPRSPD